MSVFTNPSVSAPGQAAQYIAAVVNLLGDRNPLDVLARTPGLLDEAVGGLSKGQVTHPEAEGKWSVADVLQHVADSELV